MAFTFSHFFKTRHVRVLDTTINYVDSRAGDYTMIWLHGNPSSSYVWRHIMPHVSGWGRCLSPDLLGMGDSGRHPRNQYRLEDHYEYLCAWMKAIKLSGKLVFVCHGIGSYLAFRWAYEHPDQVRALIYMEAILIPFESYDDFGPMGDIYRKMRNDPECEDEVLGSNLFLENYLNSLIYLNNRLSDNDLKKYRAPFEKPGESRRPMLTAVQELPINGEGPDDVMDIVKSYSSWLSESVDLPKLYIHAEPGLVSSFTWKHIVNWPHQKIIVVQGGEAPQEDSPEEIGKEICKFLREISD